MTVTATARVVVGGKLRRSIVLFAMAAVISASNSGCLVVGGAVVYLVVKNQAEAGGRELKEGWLEETLPYPIATVEAAAGDVRDANALPVTSTTADDATRVIESRYGDGLDVRIELSEPTPHSTAVRIRVGPGGNLGRSAHLMDTIAEFCEPAPE